MKSFFIFLIGCIVVKIISNTLQLLNPDTLIICIAILWSGYSVSQAIENKKK